MHVRFEARLMPVMPLGGNQCISVKGGVSLLGSQFLLSVGWGQTSSELLLFISWYRGREKNSDLQRT